MDASATRLRVLFVAPFPPRLAGTHGGAKVVGQLLARTAERHAAALVYLRHAGEPDVEDELRAQLALILPVDRPPPGRATAAHWVRAAHWRGALLAGQPRQVTELAVRAAAEQVGEAAVGWRPDIVRFEYPASAAYVGSISDARAGRVLADYDVLLETARLPRSRLERLEHRLDVRAWLLYRRRVLSRVDAAVVPTARDRDALTPLAGETEVATIPFGVDVEVPALDPVGADDASLVFVGNFNHVPNVDAATLLVREVLPRLRRDHPDVVLRIVGERPPEVARAPGVEAPGRVADLAPFLDAASVVVAPLRLGAGMRVKVAEALVAGKAIVASSRALEGLAVEPGRHALVADGADAIAAAVSGLLADRDRRAELGRNARTWALANLGWDAALDAHDALYERVVARRRTSAGAAENDHQGVA